MGLLTTVIKKKEPQTGINNRNLSANNEKKKLLIIIGNERVIDYMIQNVDSKKRNTGLRIQFIS